MSAEANTEPSNLIFVDLDGTLIRTDLFVESALVFLKENPLNLFRLLRWLAKGRSVAKTMLARRIHVDARSLPYERELIEYLEARRAQGARVVLATASHRSYARKVARHLGIFDDVIATSARRNRKGSTKLRAIERWAQDEPFAYAGDSNADRPIWNAAAANIHVNSSRSDVAQSASRKKLELSIRSRSSIMKSFVAGMRMHQYAKNGLIVVPLFTSHSYGELSSLVAVVWAVVCFSLCASGVYFLNDLMDLSADRQHATKSSRPLASGALPLQAGIAGAILLPVIALATAYAMLPVTFVYVLATYYVITTAYSLFLKSVVTADVMTLAVLYTLRVIAGGAAIGIVLSSWLLAFSVFIFTGLAFLKRYIEISALSELHGRAKGRGYFFEDREALFVLGSINSVVSVLVLSLYISSSDVSIYYDNPQILWLLCLLMLYWSNRLWIEARRGNINEDPVVFAIKDTVSRVILVAFVAVILLARLL